jgi:hypothetical protein
MGMLRRLLNLLEISEDRKAFFFEKKKQKTSASLARRLFFVVFRSQNNL